MGRTRGQARIGCSGWQYREWRGVVWLGDGVDVYANFHNDIGGTGLC